MSVFNNLFPLSDLEDFKITEYNIPKYIETRGFIYIMVNKHYPELFKVGRTIGIKNRFNSYNANQPEPDTELLLVSDLFNDCHYIEKKILDALKDLSGESDYNAEWFNKQYLKICITFITEAEKKFPYEDLTYKRSS